MTDQLTMHLRFGIMTELGLYQDTLVFTEEEWAKRDDNVIEAMKQGRAATWVAFRLIQIEEETALSTEEGKQIRVAEIEVKITELEYRKTELLKQLPEREPR